MVIGPAEILRRIDQIAQGGEDPAPALATLLRDMDDASPETRALVVEALTGLGVRLRQSGDSQRALPLLRAAWQSLPAAHCGGDDEARLLNNLGVVLRDVGRAYEALEAAREAAGLVRAGTELHGQILNNLGDLLADRGEFGEAIAMLSEALEIQRRIDPDSVPMARKHNNLGNAHYSTGAPSLALDSYLAALTLHERHAPETADTANTRRNVGRMFLSLGQNDAARPYFQSALEAHRRIAPESPDTGTSLSLMAQLELRDGRPAAAIDLFEQAVSLIARRANRSRPFVDALVALARARQVAGDHQGAIDDYERALPLVCDAEAGSHSLAILLEGLGEAYTSLGNVDAAIATYEQAVATAERLRACGGAPDTRESLFRGRTRPYQALIALYGTRNGPGDDKAAFAHAEAARGRALGDLLAERDAATVASTPEAVALLARKQELQQALAATYEARATDPSTAAVREVRLEQELAQVGARLRTASPTLRDVRAPEPIGLDEVQAGLPAGTLLLAYDATGADTFVWGVRRDAAAIARLALDGAALTTLVRELVEACAAAAPLRFTAAVRRRLAAAVLDPVPLTLWDGAERLLVVPDGALHYLPFDLLPRPGGTDDDLLLEALPISCAPSCTLLRALGAEREARATSWTSGAFAAFADPVFDDAAAPEVDERAIRGMTLTALPGTRAEVNAIAARFPGQARVWLGPEATERRVKTEVAGYRYVHLATHGRIDDARPLFCGLALSAPQPAELARDATLDAWLQTYEMVTLPLTAELVVCSACQTALGAVHEGEGMVGITRSLLAAGALCVVSSLWSVPDAATALLMDAFYAELVAGTPIDEALRHAKRAVRAQPSLADPFHWAAFVPFGRAD